jgi:CRISPR-associated protein Csm1
LEKKDGVCKTCEQLGELGRNLGHAQVIQLTREKSALLPGDWNAEPLRQVPDAAAKDVRFYSLNQLAHQIKDQQVTSLMVGGNQHPKDDFEAIAEQAQGIARLGILRMDVDNLGSIFGQGLNNYVHDRKISDKPSRFYSLGRVTTMSWQLSTFFSAVLRQMVDSHPENKGRVSVVYAGGDDLFILGAWDALPHIAADIREQFSRYCAGNPDFSLSGGLVLTGGKFPIYKGAELAGEAEEKAKKYKRHFGDHNKPQQRQKRALCFFDTPMDWEEFAELRTWFNRLTSHCTQTENRPLLKHLQRIATVWEGLRQAKELKMQTERQGIDLRQVENAIAAEKWCWQMVYSLSRYSRGKGTETVELVENLRKFVVQNLPESPRQGIELLGLLCRWTELYLRTSNRDNERRAS